MRGGDPKLIEWTLVLDGRFDVRRSTFSPMARIIFKNGEIMEHVFDTWKLKAKRRKFGRFRYSEFSLVSLAQGRETIDVYHGPEEAISRLFAHYKNEIIQFTGRIARGRGYISIVKFRYRMHEGEYKIHIWPSYNRAIKQRGKP